MKKNKRPPWRSQLPKFWKTAVKYRRLLIALLFCIFVLVIVGGTLEPIYIPILKSSDILLPRGSLKTSIIYIEEYKTGYRHPDPSYTQKVKDYQHKRQLYKLGFERSNNQKMIVKEMFPVTANGKDRILLIGQYLDQGRAITSLYLLDTQFEILDQVGFCDNNCTLIVSLKFTDRVWYQIGPDGSGAYIFMHEIFFSEDKIHENLIGDGGNDYTGNETYKIINISTNPKIVLCRRAIGYYLFFLLFYPFSIQYFLIHHCPYVFLLLLFFLFAILYKPIKPHLSYIRKTFLSLLNRKL